MSAWISRAARTVVRGVFLFGLWMVLVDNTHQAEMMTGAVAAAAGGVLATLVAMKRGEPAHVTPAMLRRVYRPFLLLLTDTGRVFWTLVQRLVLRREVRGRFRAARYGATGSTPDARARRILTEWGASLSPNRYVIGVEPEGGYLLVHELVQTKTPLDPLELG